MNKFLFLGVLASVFSTVSPALVQASALVKISGTMYSNNSVELGIKRGNRVYYVIKNALLPTEVDRITNSRGSTVTVRVDMRAIKRVTDLTASSR